MSNDKGSKSASSSSSRSNNPFRQYRTASLDFSAKASSTTSPVSPPTKESLSVIDSEAKRLAQELHDHLDSQGKAPPPAATLQPSKSDPIADLQVSTARKIRELVSVDKQILKLLHERKWIPKLLEWLNLHDRPAVQVETLLLLTFIAEYCSKVAGTSFFPAADNDESGSNKKGGSSYHHSMIPASGSVPFPPLSFSQTLSKDVLAAFNASLSATVQQQAAASFKFPVIKTSLPSHAFLPPPSPSMGSAFPQQLSASSQHVLLRHADAIPTLISLLGDSNREVYEQSMWILGTIAAGDSGNSSSSSSSSSSSDRDKSVAARDVILAAGVMTPLLQCLDAHSTNLSLQRIGSWTLSHLVEGIFQQSKSSSSLHSHGGSGSGGGGHRSGADYSSADEIEMDKLLPVMKRLLNMADAEVLSYTCWSLSHLCDGPSSHIAAVTTTPIPSNKRKMGESSAGSSSKLQPGGLVPRLVELLCHSSWRVTKPALRTIGNIVCAECGDDSSAQLSAPTDYTEIILDCNAVPKLKELVTHNNREIQKEACWTLSNIAAGTVDQIQAVIDSGAIRPLVKLVGDKTTDQEVRSEACWVVLNATSCGSDSQIEVLVDEGCVSVLGVLLGEASMVMMALEGLERVLQVEESREAARADDDEEETPILVSAALIEKALDKHNSSAVTKRASRIWKQHFVSCALCNKSFSKHRTSVATFCEECKCYVCSNCNCKTFHLSYQEELWAETEQTADKKKSAKKSKKAKKKEKQKQKKEQEPAQTTPKKGVQFAAESPASASKATPSKESQSQDSGSADGQSSEKDGDKAVEATKEGGGPGAEDDEEEHQIDYVLYLQQTGSIIALAKLMDALDGYENSDFDEKELQKIRENPSLVLHQ